MSYERGQQEEKMGSKIQAWIKDIKEGKLCEQHKVFARHLEAPSSRARLALTAAPSGNPFQKGPPAAGSSSVFPQSAATGLYPTTRDFLQTTASCASFLYW